MIYAWVTRDKKDRPLPEWCQSIFKVDTKIQSEVENVMCALGYGVHQYLLLSDFRANDSPHITVIEVNPAMTNVNTERENATKA